MNKRMFRLLGVVLLLSLTLGINSNAGAAANTVVAGGLNKTFMPSNSDGLTFDVSAPAYESIVPSPDGWLLMVGGQSASTHYARIRYLLPERENKTLTEFYARSVIVFPDNFWTKMDTYMRILATDNYATTLNGSKVGATNGSSRFGFFFYQSDKRLKLIVQHEGKSENILYTAPAQISAGQHVFEIYGDVSKAAPWYARVDGVIVASGNTMLSADTTIPAERVVTRMVTGVDGAANQNSQSLSLTVKEIQIADYNAGEGVGVPTNTPVIPSAAPSTAPASALPTTDTSQPTSTPAAPIVTSPEGGSVDVRVAKGSDDVEENSSGKMYIGSSDLELVYDNSNQVVGMRFAGVKIPAQATIMNAYIQFKVDEASSRAVNLTISGESSPNASAFTTAARNVSSRAKTSSHVSWSPPAWSKVGEAQRTPNLKTIVQEVVNQSRWNSGNALVLIVTGSNGKRVAKSFEGSSAGAPLLHVEFSTQSIATATLMPPPDSPTPTQILPSPTTPVTETLAPTPIPPSPTAEPINEPPIITSNAALSIAENTTAVTTVTAIDSDLPAQPLTYSISGGADSALFSINSVTGELTFITAPDFDIPTDAGIDNIYNVTVQVSDGMLTAAQDMVVSVTAVNDNNPVILHAAFNTQGGVAELSALGFNLFDISGSQNDPAGTVALINALPQGARALVWLGNLGNASPGQPCPVPGFSDAQFKAQVDLLSNNPRVFGYYLADEPHPSICPEAASALQTRSDYIHAHAPGQMAYITVMDGSNMCPSGEGCEYRAFRPEITHVDLIGLDPYPCHYDSAGQPVPCDTGKISQRVQTAIANGIPVSAIVPVFQAFGQEGRSGGKSIYYRTPTTTEFQEMLTLWKSLAPNPIFDFAYTWGIQCSESSCPAPQSLKNHPELQLLIKQHNLP